MKRPRKVALISVHDYPREDYSAHWAINVNGSDTEGYRWAAQIIAHDAPVAWLWKDSKFTTRPTDVPMPVYPADLPKGATAAQQEARLKECYRVYEAHPKPLYVIDEALDVTKTRDEADAAAQQWVLSKMPAFRRPSVPTLTDAEIEKMLDDYDAARLDKQFGTCDRIAGKLRSRGVLITPPVNASDTQRSTAHRQKGHALALGPAGLAGLIIGDLVGKLLGKARELVLMTIAYSTVVRNERLQRVQVNIDLGAGAGLLRIYDGSRPATCGTATTKLAELTFTDPAAPSASGGVLTMSAITADASADATGTATWFRCVDSTGTCCVDGSVATSASDLNLNTTSINTGVQVSVSSFVLTAGNP
jgi:hypothetical protein